MCWGEISSVEQASLHLVVSMGNTIGGNCHKYHFCRDKTHLLSRQKYGCRDKQFVAKKCLSRQNCCHDKYLSRQNYVLSRQTRVCRDKTRLLSRQKYGCLDKSFVVTNTCSIKVVAPANDREKTVPSDFKCDGGKFLQSSKRASILL